MSSAEIEAALRSNVQAHASREKKHSATHYFPASDDSDRPLRMPSEEE